MAFVKFMTGTYGRLLRIVAGIMLISMGLLVVKDTAGTIMAIAGLIPLFGGLLDYCVIGKVLGYPFSGAQTRKQLALKQQKR
jgi:hypothetical protein